MTAPFERGHARGHPAADDNRRQHVLRKGDTVLVRTPGGGYGPPSRRPAELVRRGRRMGDVGRRAMPGARRA